MITEGSFFDRIQAQWDDSLPFVVYRRPNENIVKAYFQMNEDLNVLNNYEESGFVFAPFTKNAPKILIPFTEGILCEYKVQLATPSILKEQEISLNKQNFHQALVHNGIAKIREGELRKVVLSRKQTILVENIDGISIFKNLLNAYSSAFCYLWFHPKIGMWAGATPETLLQVDRNRFKTMSLAGTQEFLGTVDVNWKEKEQEEQQMVTDTIVSSLKKMAVSSLKVSAPKSYRAGNLLHLKTIIEGNVSNAASVGSLLEELHPTPAVCGLPRKKAKAFILANEGYDREFYTGFLGELNLKHLIDRERGNRNQENKAYSAIKKTSSLFVNLRCMKLEGDMAHLFVGGGITKDSIPEKEWEETVNKSMTMRKVL